MNGTTWHSASGLAPVAHGLKSARTRGQAWLALAVAATALLLLACSGPAEAAAAPDFEITLFGNANHRAGEKLRLSDLKGKPVVVNFWFPSCPPCRLEMPDLQAAFEAHREHNVEFVGIQALGLDSRQDGQDFVEELGITYAVGPDDNGSILQAFGVSGFPATIVLDRQHRIARTWTGLVSREKLEELIAGVLE